MSMKQYINMIIINVAGNKQKMAFNATLKKIPNIYSVVLRTHKPFCAAMPLFLLQNDYYNITIDRCSFSFLSIGDLIEFGRTCNL